MLDGLLPSSNKYNDLLLPAEVIARGYVIKKLGDPEEVVFGILGSSSKLIDGSKNTNRVFGYITTNSLGIKSKTRYFVALKYLGGATLEDASWKSVSFEIEKKY